MLNVFRRVFNLSASRTFATTMVSQKIVGICQMRSTNDKLHNRQQIIELASRAKGKTDFLFFPECCDYVGGNVEETQQLAETLSGETVKFYKELCVKNQMWVSCART
jgi:predicted amidohydrolase